MTVTNVLVDISFKVLNLDTLVWTSGSVEVLFPSPQDLYASTYNAVAVNGSIFIIIVCNNCHDNGYSYEHAAPVVTILKLKTDPYSLEIIGEGLKLTAQAPFQITNVTTDGSDIYLISNEEFLRITLKNIFRHSPKPFSSRPGSAIVAHDNKLWAIGGFHQKVENRAKLSWFDLRSDTCGSIDYFPLELKSGCNSIQDHNYIPGIKGTVLDIVLARTGDDPLQKSSISAFDLKDLKRRVLVGNCGDTFDGLEWPLQVSDGSSHLLFLGYDLSDESLSRVLVVDLAPFGYTDHSSKLVLKSEKTRYTEAFSKTINSGEMYNCEITALVRPAVVHSLEKDGKEIPKITDYEGAPQDYLAKGETPGSPISVPIKVNALFLFARWPYFRRVMAEQMVGTQDKKLHLSEPFAWVKRLLEYINQDTIKGCNADEISGLLILANKYDLPRLRALCTLVIRKTSILQNFPVLIWNRARQVGETGIRKLAANEILKNWGQVVRSNAFQELSKIELIQLCLEAGSNTIIKGRRK